MKIPTSSLLLLFSFLITITAFNSTAYGQCTPTLSSPSNGAVVDNGCTGTADPITWAFAWSDCLGATRYHLYVTRKGSLAPVVDDENLTSTKFKLSLQTPINSLNLSGYTWKVRSYGKTGWGPWSRENSFSVEPVNTDCPICIPALNSPANNAELDNGCTRGSDGKIWNFDWSDCVEASSYQIEVIRPNGSVDFTNTGTESEYLRGSSTHVNDEDRFGWKWRVRSMISNVWGPWSGYGNFNVEALNTDCPLPDPPVLISPLNSAVLDNGCSNRSEGRVWDFDWQDTPGALQYQIDVIKPDGQLHFSDNISDSKYSRGEGSYISDDNLTGWKWKVKVLNGNGWSEWSSERTFSIEADNTDCPLPDPPVLTSPLNNAVMDNGCSNSSEGRVWEFDWQDTPGAEVYQIEVIEPDGQLDFNDNTLDSDYIRGRGSHVSDDQLTGWKWRVMVRNENGWSDWSSLGTFSVEPDNTDCPPPCTPSLVAPAQNAILDNGCTAISSVITWNFDWQDCTEAEFYQIQIDHGSLSIILDEVTSSGFSYSPPEKIPDTELSNWTWKVRTRAWDRWGPWSEIRDFGVENLDTDCQSCRVKLLSPVEGAELDNGCFDNPDPFAWSFSWNECEAATKYHLYVKQLDAKAAEIDLDNLTRSSYTRILYDYIDNGSLSEWSWKVRAMVNGTWGDWSPDKTFSVESLNTDCPVSCKPVMLKPSSGEVMENGCDYEYDQLVWNFDWENCPGAERYDLIIGTEGLLYNFYTDENYLVTSEYQLIRSFIDYTEMYWQVRATINGVPGPWSDKVTFKVEPKNTDCPSLSVPVLVSPLRYAILDNGCHETMEPLTWVFDWEDCPEGTGYDLQVVRRSMPDPLINETGLQNSEFTFTLIGTEPSWDDLFWRVRAIKHDQAGEWSEERPFAIETECLDDECVPLLISPINAAILDNGCSDNSDELNWDFDWNNCTGASKYHLMVFNSESASAEININNITDSKYSLSSSDFIGNEKLTGWKWKVKSMVDAKWGSWSEERSFNLEAVDSDCPASCPIILTSPLADSELDNGCSDNSDTRNWHFDWEDCSGASQYHLMAFYPGSGSPEFFVKDLTVSNYSYNTTSLISNDRLSGWIWKVRAVVNGQVGTWSEERPFNLEPLDSDCAPICIPSLLLPANGKILDNGCSDKSDAFHWDFDWEDCAEATKYHIFVSHPASPFPLVNDESIGSSEYTLGSYDYTDNETLVGWTWKVRAMVNGTWGAWSSERSFDVEGLNTDCPATCPITLISPFEGDELDNGCSDKSDPFIWDFDWEDCAEASQYHLLVSHAGSSTTILDNENISSSEFTLSSFEYADNESLLNYRWKVRAMVNETWGAWSSERSFNVEALDTDCPATCPITLISPFEGAELDNGCSDKSDPITWDFDWEDCAEASQYHLYVSHAGSSTIITNNENIAVSEYTLSSFEYADNETLLNHRWKVRAMVNGTWGAWSSERSFNVEALNMDCPATCPISLISPFEGAELDNGCNDKSKQFNWTFDWEDCVEATKYQLIVLQEGSPSPAIDEEIPADSDYTFESFEFFNDQGSAKWKWKVRAMVNDAWGAWSVERSFVVKAMNADCNLASGMTINRPGRSYNIYPNPTSEILYLSTNKGSNEEITISVYDHTGKLHFTTREVLNSEDPIQIDLSHYYNGIYFLQIKTNEFAVTEKFIKN